MDVLGHSDDEPNPVEAQWQAPNEYELPYGHPLRRDEAEDMEALRQQLRGGVETLRALFDAEEVIHAGDDGPDALEALRLARVQARTVLGLPPLGGQ